MKISEQKIKIAMARACTNPKHLSGVSPATVRRAISGEELLPATVGRIAKALCTDVAELLEGSEKT